MPFAEPYQLSKAPKQFHLRSSYGSVHQVNTRNSRVFDSLSDSQVHSKNDSDWTVRVSNHAGVKLPPIQSHIATVCQRNCLEELRNLAKTPFDPDYVLPDEVRQTLLHEGLPRTLVDKTLSPCEKRQKRAEIYNRNEMMKRESVTKKILNNTLSATTSSNSPRHSKRKTANRNENKDHSQHSTINQHQSSATGAKEKALLLPQDPTPLFSKWSPMFNSGGRMFESHNITSEHADRIKANSGTDQTLTTKLDEYPEHPRIVVVSSNVPHYLSLKGALNEEEDIITITYDFETACFEDILASIHKEIEKREEVKKARSLLLVCQGGPGYLYLLKRVVVTPQKMKREDYISVVEFWKNLGRTLSKLFPDSGLHILGPDSRDDHVKKLQDSLTKVVKPTKAKLRILTNDSTKDKVILEKYFHYKRFQFWKSNKHSSCENINFAEMYDSDEDVARSWSDICGSGDEEITDV